jgi:hypothetical protein
MTTAQFLLAADEPENLPGELSADLRFPIGPPDRNPALNDLPLLLNAIQQLPRQFSEAYSGLSDAQLDMPYRDGGWTLRQLAHHVADSHMNAFVRTKLALTEDWPTITAYNEKLWAETAEVRGNVEPPLALLAALHLRMHALLAGLDEAQWQRGYVHPESGRATLLQVAALYAWHGRHHTAHANGLRQRLGW